LLFPPWHLFGAKYFCVKHTVKPSNHIGSRVMALCLSVATPQLTDGLGNHLPVNAVPPSARGFEVDVATEGANGTGDDDAGVEGHGVYSFHVWVCELVGHYGYVGIVVIAV
jgi:hypothetical protein